MFIFPPFSIIKTGGNAGSWFLRCIRVEAMAGERKQKSESMGKERLSFVQKTGSPWQKKKNTKDNSLADNLVVKALRDLCLCAILMEVLCAEASWIKWPYSSHEHHSCIFSWVVNCNKLMLDLNGLL